MACIEKARKLHKNFLNFVERMLCHKACCIIFIEKDFILCIGAYISIPFEVCEKHCYWIGLQAPPRNAPNLELYLKIEI